MERRRWRRVLRRRLWRRRRQRVLILFLCALSGFPSRTLRFKIFLADNKNQNLEPLRTQSAQSTLHPGWQTADRGSSGVLADPSAFRTPLAGGQECPPYTRFWASKPALCSPASFTRNPILGWVGSMSTPIPKLRRVLEVVGPMEATTD